MAENILDNLDDLLEIDKSNSLKTVSEFPEMLLHAKKLAQEAPLSIKGNFDQIVIAGMGGSAISGDIINNALSEKLDIPIFVIRDYSLPKYISSNALLFAVSYSGNTEETISVLKDAKKRGVKIISVTSGGEIKSISSQENYPIVLVPAGIQPRTAFPYLLVSILIMLEKLGIINGISEQIDEVASVIKRLKQEYTAPERENQVKQLARKLISKIPMILSSEGSTDGVGLRWKTQLNENSKTTAINSNFPELTHNEIVNLASLIKGKHNFFVVILRDEDDNERVKKKIEITKSLISPSVGGITEVNSKGRSRLARLLSLVYFGDLLSIYLAVLNGIDPTPVKIIEKLKKELAR